MNKILIAALILLSACNSPTKPLAVPTKEGNEIDSAVLDKIKAYLAYEEKYHAPANRTFYENLVRYFVYRDESAINKLDEKLMNFRDRETALAFVFKEIQELPPHEYLSAENNSSCVMTLSVSQSFAFAKNEYYRLVRVDTSNAYVIRKVYRPRMKNINGSIEFDGCDIFSKDSIRINNNVFDEIYSTTQHESDIKYTLNHRDLEKHVFDCHTVHFTFLYGNKKSKDYYEISRHCPGAYSPLEKARKTFSALFEHKK